MFAPGPRAPGDAEAQGLGPEPLLQLIAGPSKTHKN